MNKIKIGILREGKVPVDHRVSLTPKQCKAVQVIYPEVEILVQPSQVRAFCDDDYRAEGIRVEEDLSDCAYLFGVKEVNKEDLIPGKTYFFFSHTIKKQTHNRELLQEILRQKIRLIDYETIRTPQNKRIIGFGRYAGIVGAYNGFRTYGLKTGEFDLKPAYLCKDRAEMEAELQKVNLPDDLKIVLTGFGRVGHGAREIIDLLPIQEVTPDELIEGEFDSPVFAQLEAADYYGHKDGKPFDKSEFYAQPELYVSTFDRFLPHIDIYMPCHFWNTRSPKIIPAEALKPEHIRLKVVADISCDVNGPIASTIRTSKIQDPVYGYHPQLQQEADYKQENVIAVMAVDNLPCELPKDASEDFGIELMRSVLPALLREDEDQVLEKATITDQNGHLTPQFAYLQDYVEGKV